MLFTKADISKLYLGGMTQQEIAEQFATTKRVVAGILKKSGVKCRVPVGGAHGSDNPHWKGASAGYGAKHQRIKRLLGSPKRCEICGTTDPDKRYEWANLTGKFDDPADYKRMCAKCHRHFDKIYERGSGRGLRNYKGPWKAIGREDLINIGARKFVLVGIQCTRCKLIVGVDASGKMWCNCGQFTNLRVA